MSDGMAVLGALASIALLITLLVLVPTWIVIRDLLSGRPDPGLE